MHDYKLKTSLKISLLRVNDHARTPFPEAERWQIGRPLYVVVVGITGMASKPKRLFD